MATALTPASLCRQKRSEADNGCNVDYSERNQPLSFLIGGFSGRKLTRPIVFQMACLLASLICASAPASAQSLTTASYGVFVGGQALDLHSTRLALNHGAVESNPLLRGSFPQIVAKKSLLSAGVLIGAWYLDTHGRHKLANAIRFAGGGTGVAAAVHNYRVMR